MAGHLRQHSLTGNTDHNLTGLEVIQLLNIDSSGSTISSSGIYGENGILTATTYYSGTTPLETIISSLSSGGVSGKLGISDSNGQYIFYSSYTDAISAATIGQCVEQFADIIETGNIELTLKDGVNIDGHGHTYTLDNPGSFTCFQDASLINISILNLNVKRINGNGQTLHLSNGSTVIGDGSIFTTTFAAETSVWLNNSKGINITAYGTNTGILLGGADPSLSNLIDCKGFGGNYGIRTYSGGGTVKDSYGEATLWYGIFNAGGKTYNSTGIGPVAGIYADDGFNCIGISETGSGFVGQGTNCTGLSTSGIGYEGHGNNCVGKSVSGYGMYVNNAKNVYNCVGISSSSVGIRLLIGSSIYGGVFSSDLNYGCIITGNAEDYIISSASIISNWDDAVGYAILDQLTGTNSKILNNTLKVFNAGANGYFTANAKTIKYSGNIFDGTANIVNADATQGIINTLDNQGNIIIN